jgi:hypothetical protein
MAMLRMRWSLTSWSSIVAADSGMGRRPAV